MRHMWLKGRKGITLIEALVYIAILSFVIGTIYSIYYNCSRIAKVGNSYIHTLRYTDLAISTMQRDIRQAKEIIPSVGNFVTGRDVLILKSSIGEGSYIIYRFNKEKGRIERVFVPEGVENTHSRTMGVNLQGIKFSCDKESLTQSRLVTVELIFGEGVLKKAKETSFNFSVLLRG